MVYDIAKGQHIEKVITTHRAVLIIVYDSRRHERGYIRVFSEGVAPAFEPEIPVLRVDLAAMRDEDVKRLLEFLEVKDHSELPLVRLYYRGKPMWSQYGLFYDYRVDREALRRGLWVTLEAWGLSPRDLGIRFARMY